MARVRAAAGLSSDRAVPVRCSRALGRVDRVPTIGVSIAIPSPHAEMLQAQAGVVRRPAGRLDPDPRHAPAADRGGGRRPRRGRRAHLEDVAASGHSFPMVLRGTGTFRPISPVVFVQVSGGLADCELLEKAVRRGPLERNLEFYYHPHVTVAHHLRRRGPRPGVHRPGGLRVHLRGGRVPPLRARRRRRLAPGPHLSAGLTGALMMQTLKAWWARLQTTSALAGVEAVRRPRGNLLAGGVGYFAFFSIFPAVLLAFTVFGIVLRRPAAAARRHPRRDQRHAARLREVAEQPDGIISVEAPPGAALSIIGGVVSVVGLVLAGTGWLERPARRDPADLRRARRPRQRRRQEAPGPRGPRRARRRASSLSAAVGAVAGAAAGWVADLVGLGGQGWVLTRRGAARGRRARRRHRPAHAAGAQRGRACRGGGCAAARSSAGSALTLLKKFGTLLIASTTDNPLFASLRPRRRAARLAEPHVPGPAHLCRLGGQRPRHPRR